MSRDQLETELRIIERLFEAVPEWNDSAKVRGKLLTARRAICECTEAPAALSASLAELETALWQIQRADPLTLMLARVSAWRATLGQS